MRMDSAKVKKLVLLNLPYGIVFIAVLQIIPLLPSELTALIPDVIPDFLIALAAAVTIRAVVYFRGKNAKKWRRDVEYGSARWGTEKDIKPYVDPNPKNNIILTQTESLSMNSRPKPVKYARNKNVLVIGGSGSGKTRFFVKPNLMQCESEDYPVSFVCTDPKGSILTEVGTLLKRRGYRIKVINTIDFKRSMRYNPLLCY